MTVKLLNGHNLEFLNLKGGYTGSSESIYVKMQRWKSHVKAQILSMTKVTQWTCRCVLTCLSDDTPSTCQDAHQSCWQYMVLLGWLMKEERWVHCKPG